MASRNTKKSVTSSEFGWKFVNEFGKKSFKKNTRPTILLKVHLK